MEFLDLLHLPGQGKFLDPKSIAELKTQIERHFNLVDRVELLDFFDIMKLEDLFIIL